MSNIRWMISLLAVLWLVSWSIAADGDSQPLFRVLGYGDSRFEGLLFKDAEGELVALEFQPNRRSRSYVLPEGRSQLVILTRTTDSRGREKLDTVARVDLISGAKQQLLLFIATISSTDSSLINYEVTALDESPEAFAPGDVRIVNLSGATLKAQLGSALFDVEPGVVPMKRLPLDSDVPQPMRFAVAYNDDWRVVHSTVTRADARYGTLLVLKPPAEEGSLRLRVERVW